MKPDKCYNHATQATYIMLKSYLKNLHETASRGDATEESHAALQKTIEPQKAIDGIYPKVEKDTLGGI